MFKVVWVTKWNLLGNGDNSGNPFIVNTENITALLKTKSEYLFFKKNCSII